MLTATNYKYRNFTSSKIACFISVDPKIHEFPFQSSYVYAGNNPIKYIDVNGENAEKPTDFYDIKTGEHIWHAEDGKDDVVLVSMADFAKGSNKYFHFFDVNTPMGAEGITPENYSKQELAELRVNLILGQESAVNIEVEMPGVIKGFEDAKYQQYYKEIAAQVAIFNYKKNYLGIVPTHSNGEVVNDISTVPDLDVNLVKAIIMIETLAGNYPQESPLNNPASDIMQANVWFGPKQKNNDWDDSKEDFGLVKAGGVESPIQSIYAGIGILYRKGLTSTGDWGNYKTEWTGGNNWMKAVSNYNNSNNVETYVKKAKKYTESAKK